MPRQNASRSLSITSQESHRAVIIADLVADLPDEPECVSRNNSIKHPSLNRNGSMKKKDKTNLGYDDHLDKTAAVVNVDSMDTVSLGLAKANGTNISKGVILNAQFNGPSDSNKMAQDEKSMELSNSHSVQVSDANKEIKDEVISDFSEMSLSRKVAFGFSFLPSIMFVLCFAVILPCEKKLPCLQELWSTTLNNTEVTSGFKVPGNIVLAHAKITENGLTSFDINTGNRLWTVPLESASRDLDCGKVTSNTSEACMVLEPTGYLHLFNATNGDRILNGSLGKNAKYSIPVVVPDCDGDGIDEIAVADSPSRIRIVFLGIRVTSVEVTGCETVPSRLTPWKRGKNDTDLVFVCQNGASDRMMRIPQESWCNRNPKSKLYELETRSSGVLTQSTLLTTDDGNLVLWAEDEITLFESAGGKNWSVSSEPHHNKNRFLLDGKFMKSEKAQIALFSSDISKSLEMSLLDIETGNTVWNKSISNADISDVARVHGENSDFVLVHKRKIERDLASEVSSSIQNLLTNGEMSNATGSKMIEETTLMELGGNALHNIQENSGTYLQGESFRTSLTVVPKETKGSNVLLVVVMKTSKSKPSSASLRSIQVSNWDISQPENRQCIWK